MSAITVRNRFRVGLSMDTCSNGSRLVHYGVMIAGGMSKGRRWDLCWNASGDTESILRLPGHAEALLGDRQSRKASGFAPGVPPHRVGVPGSRGAPHARGERLGPC
jgi:hypothetical protein